MVAAMLKQTKLKVLLSLNAAAILIAGFIIAAAIWVPKDASMHLVSERSDELSEGEDREVGMIAPATDSNGNGPVATNTAGDADGYKIQTVNSISDDPVPNGELWNETAFTLYQSADQDICIGGGLAFDEMYWQTSNTSVIEGFYQARNSLGYDSNKCRFPKIVGTGTTTITAGTYDGSRRDTLTITVVTVPVEQWKHEVLELVNKEREKEGLAALSWGTTCEGAAQVRAGEIVTSYSHTRPDGSEWKTVCPIPSTGGYAGENLAGGISSVSPATVVRAWMNSPEHKANILSPNFTKLSVGFVFDPDSKYKTYWSQFFSTY